LLNRIAAESGAICCPSDIALPHSPYFAKELKLKTIIGAFDTAAQAENAARALVNAGFLRDDISVIANNEAGTYGPVTTTTDDAVVTGHAVGHDAKVGAEWGAGIGFVVGLTGLAIPGLGWIATAGWFAGTLLGAGTGAIIGGLVGALTHIGVPHEEAVQYTEAVRRGSVLLAVRAEDASAQRAADILNNSGAININERGAQYRQEGWQPAHAESYMGPTPGQTVGNMTAATANRLEHPEGNIPGIQTGGHALDGTPDTRGILEKTADTLTGDRIDDKTGKPV
jgi:hypothetical protein